MMHERLSFIAGKEGITLLDGCVEACAVNAGGDLRKAITLLQRYGLGPFTKSRPPCLLIRD